MLPDLESLRCFEAAARHRSFRAAAREVALSPPAFSDRIKRLEDDLDARLFERTTRRVDLTDAGTRLLPKARAALEAATACWSAVHEDATAPYEVELGTRWELGLSWLTPSLEPLSRQTPERTVHLVFGDSPELLERLLDGRLDCAVTSARLSSAKYAYAALHEEAYAFVGAPDLLEAHPITGPDDAGEHTLMDVAVDLPLFRYFADASSPGELWAFQKVERLGAIAAIRHRALESAGVCVLPRYLIGPDLAAGRLVEPMPDRKIQSDFFRLVWRTGHPREPELIELAKQLRALPLS